MLYFCYVGMKPIHFHTFILIIVYSLIKSLLCEISANKIVIKNVTLFILWALVIIPRPTVPHPVREPDDSILH